MRASVDCVLEAQKNESVLTETTQPVGELTPERQSMLVWKSIWSNLAETTGSIQKHLEQK
ncbi:MAG: hypothetical protein HW412_1254 [Bacteroidetes bacterium]|nr:hypothetical protein [Bacteroidota bacterium]